MPPLELTGERTLPDVPEENYWYRRHVAVYEWIAERCDGLRVVDLACGEGYGSDLLARARRRGDRRRRQPGGLRARPPALRARQPELRARPGRGVRRAGATPSSSCRRSSTSTSRTKLLDAIARIAPGRLHLDPQPAHARPPGAREVRQPLAPARVRRRPSTASCWSRTSPRSRSSASSTPASCASTSWRSRLGWDRVHPALRLTKPFYDRFIPAISARDFALRDEPRPALDFVADLPALSRDDGRRPRDRPAQPHALRRGVRDLSLRRGVAVRRGRALAPAGAGGRRAADDDRHPGAGRPARGRRGGGADAGVPAAPPARRRRARRGRGRGRCARRGAEAEHYAARSSELEVWRERAPRLPGGHDAGADRADGLGAPPTPCCRSWPPRRGGACRSTRGCARIGAASGPATASGCRSAPTSPGLEALLAERGIAYTCLDQSAHESGRRRADAGSPARRDRRLHDRLADGASWSGRTAAIPSDPAYLEYHRLSENGTRLWSIAGDPYDPEARASARGGATPPPSSPRSRAARAPPASARGRRGLCVFAIDTELLGHWWAEGPRLARPRSVAAADGAGVRLLTLPEALEEHEAEQRPPPRRAGARARPSRPGTRRAVADLVWGARRLELRLLRALRGAALAPRRPRPCGPRASCSPCSRATGRSWTTAARRATTRSRACRARGGDAGGHRLRPGARPRMRNLAPDLSLGAAARALTGRLPRPTAS